MNEIQILNLCRSRGILYMNIGNNDGLLIVLKCICEKSSGDRSLCKYDIYENPSCNSIHDFAI